MCRVTPFARPASHLQLVPNYSGSESIPEDRWCECIAGIVGRIVLLFRYSKEDQLVFWRIEHFCAFGLGCLAVSRDLCCDLLVYLKLDCLGRYTALQNRRREKKKASTMHQPHTFDSGRPKPDGRLTLIATLCSFFPFARDVHTYSNHGVAISACCSAAAVHSGNIFCSFVASISPFKSEPTTLPERWPDPTFCCLSYSIRRRAIYVAGPAGLQQRSIRYQAGCVQLCPGSA